MATKIEWTRGDDGSPGETWNPVVGCSIASPGCDNCYAARQAAGRLASTPAYKGLSVRNADGVPTFTGEVRCLPERLDQPLKWRKPRRIFVNSMSDLFHPGVLDGFIAEVFAVMAAASEHTFQVLTKRPQRMARLLWSTAFHDLYGYTTMRLDIDSLTMDEALPLPNVWLGTSIENQRYADLRIPQLLATPAVVRFLSIEPLLGPVALRAEWLGGPIRRMTGRGWDPRIDWVIVGGESGPHARSMHPDWVREIRDQCVAAGVPFFVKQLSSGGPRPIHDIDQFPEDLRIREYPA